MRRLTFLALLFSTPTAVAAEPSPADAATEVLDAIAADKPDALAALARRDAPDPWLVAAELSAGGHHDAARKFVFAAPRADTARLLAHLDAWQKDPAARATLKDAIPPKSNDPQASATAGRHAEKLGWLRRAADCYRTACAGFHRRGDNETAFGLAQSWLRVEQLRGNDARLAPALLEAGRMAKAANRAAEAHDLAKHALRQAQKGDDPVAIARSESLLGRTLAARGRRENARVYLLRAHDALEDSPENRLELLLVLRALAKLDATLDGVEAGLRRAEEMLAVAREANVPEAVGDALVAIAQLEAGRGALVDALDRYEGAVKAYADAKRAGPRAEAMLAKGELETRLSRPEDAEATLAAALAIATTDALRARLHAARADAALRRGDDAAAEKSLAAAAKLSTDPALRARALLQRGRLLGRAGKDDAAEKSLGEAASALRKEELRDEALAAEIERAAALRRLGRRDEAMELAQFALREATREENPEAYARAAALHALLMLGEEKAEALIDRVRASARAAIALREKSGRLSSPAFDRSLDDLLRVGIDAAIGAGDLGVLLAASEYGRARRMLRMLGGRARLLRAMTPEALAAERDKLAGERARRSSSAIRSTRKGMRRGPMEKSRARIAAIDGKIAAIDKRVEQEVARAAWMLAPSVQDVETIESALAPSETLLSFCVGTERVAVVRVTPAGSSLVDLGKRTDLARAVAAFRAGFATDDPESAEAALRTVLLEPLGIDDGRELVVVPASLFADVPWCALAPENPVRYVASVAAFLRAAEGQKRQGTGVLAVGDPEYGDGKVRLTLVNLRGGVPLRRLETRAQAVRRDRRRGARGGAGERAAVPGGFGAARALEGDPPRRARAAGRAHGRGAARSRSPATTRTTGWSPPPTSRRCAWRQTSCCSARANPRRARRNPIARCAALRSRCCSPGSGARAAEPSRGRGRRGDAAAVALPQVLEAGRDGRGDGAAPRAGEGAADRWLGAREALGGLGALGRALGERPQRALGSEL